jgi:hypothetical protein
MHPHPLKQKNLTSHPLVPKAWSCQVMGEELVLVPLKDYG